MIQYNNCFGRAGVFMNICKYILRPCICRCINNEMNVRNGVVAWNNVQPTMNSWSNSEFIDDVWLDVFIWIWWHVRMLSIISHVYNYTASEAQYKLLKSWKSNLVIFLGVGAFEQLFGPGRWGFEEKFSKNSNARGIAQGGGDVEASNWLRHCWLQSVSLCSPIRTFVA